MTDIVNTFVEIKLPSPDNFLKIKETLTRIGVASKKEKTLYQSCHILHKRGRYFVIHFKELFALDGKTTDFTEEDLGRRNTIANLLHDWGLCDLYDGSVTEEPVASMGQIKIISHKEKNDWNLKAKYTIGKR